MGFEPMMRVLQTLAFPAWPRRPKECINYKGTHYSLSTNEIEQQRNSKRKGALLILEKIGSVNVQFCYK